MITLVVVVTDTGVLVEHRDARGRKLAEAPLRGPECRELAARLTQAADRLDEVRLARVGGKPP